MFEKKVWNDRQSEHPARRRLTPTENDNEYEVSRAEGLVMEEGDAFDATTMNDLENRVAKAFAEYDPAELGAVNVTVQLYTCKKEGTAASSSKGLHVAGSIVDRGNWSAQIVPGGKVTIPPGRHAGDGSVSAAALKTMALRVSDWPHEYPGMEWHYTLTGGTLVGVAGLGRASGDASSNVIESIRIAGNTIYVKNASGGYPMRDITLLYY